MFKILNTINFFVPSGLIFLQDKVAWAPFPRLSGREGVLYIFLSGGVPLGS